MLKKKDIHSRGFGKTVPEGVLDMRRICVLTSGGIDSALLLGEALASGHEIHPLYVATGLVWEAAEQHHLQILLNRLATERLKALSVLRAPLKDLFPDHWAFGAGAVPDAASPDEAVYLPARNLILLSQAAVFSEARRLEEVWIGVLKGNPFGDGRKDFFRAFEESCRLALPHPLKISAPFAELSKPEAMARHSDFPLDLAFSCLAPRGLEPCGRCNKCEELRRALAVRSVK
ncbi:MAG TPA: 7-cyano-7-deazaguanine synthase [Deltaproteobacteria bacterium]|nr:7-cyano-7-deazaguanine synthase [Deltaproteobacteria bacterium]